MLWFFLLVYCFSHASCSEMLRRHRRAWIVDSFEIEEGNPGPFPYPLGKINVDRKYQVFFELTGEGVDEEPKGVLSIHRESGTLYVHKALDYEKKTLLKLRFEARKTDLSTDTKLGVEVSILDINDNPPRFQTDLYEINVNEETTQGSDLLIVVAHDIDQRGTPNSTFHYELKSVSPRLPDTEFFIEKSGRISFKGCLSYEAAERITLLVEAKDHGEVVSLSSSTTVLIHVQDGNNHLPVISGLTGPRMVKEGESGFSPLRLHVTDGDTPYTRAWKATYTLHGDNEEHFKIETDPDTNDGVLTVVKPLDFEKVAQRELWISVKNEAPYFSCKVKERTSSGLWTLDTSTDLEFSSSGQSSSVKVIVEVEDVNDPPMFTVTVKEAQLVENAAVGTWVEKVTAVDPDASHARDFVYKVGHDPAGWVTVDPKTGDITTVKIPDRESPHVVEGLYIVLVHAVDEGDPPMTGTATLQIHVTDQNDNVPQPVVSFLDVCLSDSPTTTNITAFDLDGDPFGGPFTFQLLGDVEGKWKLNPTFGYTAGLVKEPSVYAGPHNIDLKITDMQGTFGVYNLSVTVCDCSENQNCRSRQASAGKVGSGAIGIVFATLFLILFLFLLLVVISCKKEFAPLQTEYSSEDTLVPSNIEKPGTDCKVPVIPVSPKNRSRHHLTEWQTLVDGGMRNTSFSTKDQQQYSDQNITNYTEDISYLYSDSWNQTNWNSLLANSENHTRKTAWNAEMANSYDHKHKFETSINLHQRSTSYEMEATLCTLIHRRLGSLQEAEVNMDCEPRLYAEEGSSENLSDFESIITQEEEPLQKVLNNLDMKFYKLALICKPTQVQN